MTQAATLNDTLEFGLFDWIEWDQSAPNEIFESRLKMLEYADRSGFYSYHLAEHHITPLSVSPSPAVFLAAAAQRTSKLRLGPLVFLMPFYNPIRLFHEICMLDNLSNGRLDLGVGRGVSPIEAEKFDVDLDVSWEVFNEQMDMFTGGFTTGILNHQGKHYNYEDIELWIKPYQKPYPPLWYASNNIASVPWMAQHGFNTCTVFADNAGVKAHFDLYKQVWNAERMSDGLNSHVPVPQTGTRPPHVHCCHRRTGQVGGQTGLSGVVPQHRLPVGQGRPRPAERHEGFRPTRSQGCGNRGLTVKRQGAGPAGN